MPHWWRVQPLDLRHQAARVNAGAMRGNAFAERVEALIADRPNVSPIVGPMLAAWLTLREQVAAFDKAVRAEVKESPACAGCS